MPTKRAPSGPHATAAGRGSETRNRGSRTRNQQEQTVSSKFKGNSEHLQGNIFDCSDCKQADNFVTTLKHISEYVSAEYKRGGDIRASILNEGKITIPVPVATTVADLDTLTPEEKVH